MSSRTKALLVFVCLTAMTTFATAPCSARCISLCVDKNCAHNAGGDSITFSWKIVFDTQCQEPVTFLVLDPAGNPCPAGSFTIPCASGLIEGSHKCDVPAGQPTGVYTAVLTFHSKLGAITFTDTAQVQFAICPAGILRVCKFLDLNGDGQKQDNEPPLSGWTFWVKKLDGTPQSSGTTDATGCTGPIIVPVDASNSTTYCVCEAPPTPDSDLPWMRTTPSPGPYYDCFPVVVHGGPAETVVKVGNWVPIKVSGAKYEDLAPWQWNKGENPACAEPPPGSIPCPPFGPVGVGGAPIILKDVYGNVLGQTLTSADGTFLFGPIHYRPNLRIEQYSPPPVDLPCDPTQPGPQRCSQCALSLAGWTPPQWIPTAATTMWPQGSDFATPTDIDMVLPKPPLPNQEYGFNYFYDRLPSRLWGMVYATGSATLPDDPVIEVYKSVLDTYVRWPMGDAPCCDTCGFYFVQPEPEEIGLRHGCTSNGCSYVLKPPAAPANCTWLVQSFCVGENATTQLAFDSDGYVRVCVPPGRDVRIDFVLTRDNATGTRCFLPVTLTQQGWHDFADTTNPILPGGLIFSKFAMALDGFSFYGTPASKTLIVGKLRTITFENKKSALNALTAFLPQTGPAGSLKQSYLNPYLPTEAGELAGETVALMLNIAYNDRQQMPRTKGYYLEQFTINRGYFKGMKVGQVLNYANAILGGDPPRAWNIPDYQTLVDTLKQINANYEFVNFETFNDRGFLQPNQPFNGLFPTPKAPKAPYP